MSKNEEGLSLVEGGALLVERVVPKRGTFTLIMPDTMCFEVSESGIGEDATLRFSAQDAARAGGDVAAEVRHVTAAEKRWQVHVVGWTRSGLSCKEYAAQVGVHPGTLAA